MSTPRSNNTQTSTGLRFETSCHEDLQAFDELPSPIRQALSEHVHPLAARPILEAWIDPDFRQDLDCVERMAFVLDQIRSFRP